MTAMLWNWTCRSVNQNSVLVVQGRCHDRAEQKTIFPCVRAFMIDGVIGDVKSTLLLLPLPAPIDTKTTKPFLSTSSRLC